jgi:hypothetical protein
MMDKDQDKGMNRREFIRKAAITGAVAWAVPAIQTVAATPAYAQTNGTPAVCPHSPPGGEEGLPGETCMSTCKGACGTSTGCAAICNSVCARGVCCANACNPGAWSCVGGSPQFAGC